MRLVEENRGRTGGLERGRPGRHADPRVTPLDDLRRQPRTLRADHHDDPPPEHRRRHLAPPGNGRRHDETGPPSLPHTPAPPPPPPPTAEGPPPPPATAAAMTKPASRASRINSTVSSSLATGAWKMEP